VKKLDLISIFLILLFIIPNLRPIFKYSPVLPMLIMIIYSILIYGLIAFSQIQSVEINLKKWLGNYWFIFFVLVIVTLIISQIYPIADNLKLQGRGSDQDNCVIAAANQILSLRYPYSIRSYFGNPCSPLPGMLFLYLPFVYLNLYYIGAVFFAILAIVSIKQFTESLYSAAFFTTLLFGSIFHMEMLVVGSDLFLLGCGFVIVALKTAEAIIKVNLKTIIILAILTGLLSNTRINFVVLAPIMSFFIFLHWKKAGVIFGFISLCFVMLPSGYLFYLNPEEFTPLHLLSKSDSLLRGGLKEVGVTSSIFAFLVGIYLTTKTPKNIPLSLLISLSPMLLAVALGDLIHFRKGQFSTWEGANYLLPIIPLALAIVTINLKRNNNLR